MTAPFDFAGVARELIGCPDDCHHGLCAAARERTERVLREAHAAGQERMRDRCAERLAVSAKFAWNDSRINDSDLLSAEIDGIRGIGVES